MESPTAAATTDSPPGTFSQVVFNAVPHSYPPRTPITCCYTLTAACQAKRSDWVGIFKVGWNTIKDYHTFVWVEPYLDLAGQQPVTRQAAFTDYYLPKDELDFYQFCYIDSTGQVRGASTHFCFRHPMEQSLSNQDDDLLIITTREQLEQSMHEKAELQKELSQITEENETLKRALEKEQQEVASLKEQNGQKEKERGELVKELDQMKEQNENLTRQLTEMGHLQFESNEEEKERCSADLQELQNLAREMVDMKRELSLQDCPDEDQTIKLREAHESIADQDAVIEEKGCAVPPVSQEKAELAGDNQSVTSDIEGLDLVIADLHTASPVGSPDMKPDSTSPAGSTSPAQCQEPETPEETAMGSFADPEQEALLCRHCQECFPLITQQELMEHEHSHRICPFCTMICDGMEQSVFEDHVYSHEL